MDTFWPANGFSFDTKMVLQFVPRKLNSHFGPKAKGGIHSPWFSSDLIFFVLSETFLKENLVGLEILIKPYVFVQSETRGN